MNPDIEDDYLKAFSLSNPIYRKVKPMQKPLVGISFVIDHNKETLKKLNLDGNYVCLMQIYLKKDWRDTLSTFKQIIGVAHFTIDTGIDQENYPVLNLRKSLGVKIPIELESNDEYFFNIENKKFYKNCEEIKFNCIVEDLFNQHLKPTRRLTGMYLRFKLRMRYFCNALTLNFAKLITFFIFVIFGEEVGYDFFSEYSIKNKKPPITEEIKKIKTLNIFGYEASTHLIFLFCLVHLLGYFIVIYFNINLPISYRSIFKSNFLTLIYSITFLYIFEQFLKPLSKMFLYWLLSKAKKVNQKITYMATKI